MSKAVYRKSRAFAPQGFFECEGVHRHWILQRPEVAGAVVSCRGGAEIGGAGVMHIGEFRTEPVGGVSCGGAGGDAFDIQIVPAPFEDLDHGDVRQTTVLHVCMETCGAAM